MSSWGFAFTPILLNLAHSSYRNGEVQGLSVLVLANTPKIQIKVFTLI
jgi:hypothetical protein